MNCYNKNLLEEFKCNREELTEKLQSTSLRKGFKKKSNKELVKSFE